MILTTRKQALTYVHDEVSSISDILAEISFNFRGFRDGTTYVDPIDDEADQMIVENLQAITSAVNNIKDLTGEDYENTEGEA